MYVALMIFWGCLAALAYIYFGYPILLSVCAKWFGRKRNPAPMKEDDLPSVTLLVAAYDEEDVIGERVANALALDYPADRFEILVASDGSADRTAEIVRQFTDPRVRLLDFQVRRGKSSVVNDAMREAQGDVVILSDANTMMKPDAARQLVKWFSDPEVGTVCGRLDLQDSKDGKNVDGVYWKYENFLKVHEGRLDAVLGANGAIYAIRKEAFQEIPADTLIDDLTIPLLSKLRTGLKTVYDGDAVAVEETAPDLTSEFRRRARIGTGGAQAISRLFGLLHPRHGWTALAFLSHKVLRWTSPLFLVGLLVANVFLLSTPIYMLAFGGQIAFYLLAAINGRIHVKGFAGRLFRLPTLFVGVNAALLVGMVRWLRRQQNGVWIRTPRTAQAAPGVATA